jgi:hypothetical protein
MRAVCNLLEPRGGGTIMKTNFAPVLAILFVSSCATTAANPGAGAHPSAAQQEAAANADEQEAARHRASFDPDAVALRERYCSSRSSARERARGVTFVT